MTGRRKTPRRVGSKRRYGAPTTYTGRPRWASLVASLLAGWRAGITPTPKLPRKDRT